MRILPGLLIFAGVGVIGYAARLLSPDAVAMAIGVLFGVLAGVPMALMLFVADRERRKEGPPPQNTIYVIRAGRTGRLLEGDDE